MKNLQGRKTHARELGEGEKEAEEGNGRKRKEEIGRKRKEEMGRRGETQKEGKRAKWKGGELREGGRRGEEGEGR